VQRDEFIAAEYYMTCESLSYALIVRRTPK